MLTFVTCSSGYDVDDSGGSSSDNDEAPIVAIDDMVDTGNECTMLDVDEMKILGAVSLQRNYVRQKIELQIDETEWTVPNSDLARYISPEELCATSLGLIDDATLQDELQSRNKIAYECGSVSLTLRREGTSVKQQVYAMTMAKVCFP